MSSPQYSFEPAPDDWVRVSGGDLAQPIAIQVRVSAHRARIVGLRIANDTEVTSASLRRLRLGRIAHDLLLFVQSEAGSLEDSFEWSLVALEDASTDPDQLAARQQLDDAQTRLFLFREWAAALQDASDDLDGRQRGRGSKPPTVEELQAFAKEYLRQAIAEPLGAVTRTANNLHFDRATAYRWLKLCRESTPPLLPPKDA